jgi:hypothetical protein
MLGSASIDKEDVFYSIMPTKKPNLKEGLESSNNKSKRDLD